MARLSREFVKLETRLLNDHRFFTMTEFEQLVFIKLLGVSRSTSNQIPKKIGVVGELLRTKRSATEIKSAIKRIKTNFPKFKENKYFYYFDDYELRLNNSAPKSSGMGCVDEDEDIDEDIDKDIVVPHPGTNKVFNHFCLKYKEVFTKDYVANFGKDKKLIKDLLNIIKEDELIVLINRFFESDDDFIQKSGFTLGVFKSQINKLRERPKSSIIYKKE
jgi:hypothetical protein